MYNYIRFDNQISLNKKSYKILLFILVLSLTLLIISNIFINKNSNDEIKIISKNSRRIINKIDNYTETMSEFIVNTDNNVFNQEILNTFNDFKLKQLNLQEKEIEVQNEIKEYFKIYEEKKLNLQEKEIEVQNEIKNIQIRKNAINFLEKNYGIFSKDFNLDFFINNNCVKNLLQLNIDLFTLLLNIDYDNLTISFNYFYNNYDYNDYYDYEKIISLSKSYFNIISLEHDYISYKLLRNNKNNIINNPVYNIIKNKLEFNYNYSFEELIPTYIINDYYNYNTYIENINIIDFNDIYYNTIENITYVYPYKNKCNIYSINHTLYKLSFPNGYYNEIWYYINLNEKIPIKQLGQHLNNDLGFYMNKYINNIVYYYSHHFHYYIVEFNYIKIYNEYEYIKKIINLENIPIIPPIKFY